MILNHLWGLYTHPKEEWHNLQQNHENLLYSASHILLIALIPAICSFFTSVYLGWTVNAQPLPLKTPLNGALASLSTYIIMVFDVLLLALVAKAMAKRFGGSAKLTQALELSAYASTPIFVLGFCVLYPKSWFLISTTIAALSYSIYLLYGGIDILINIEKDQKNHYYFTLIGTTMVIFGANYLTLSWLFTS